MAVDLILLSLLSAVSYLACTTSTTLHPRINFLRSTMYNTAASPIQQFDAYTDAYIHAATAAVHVQQYVPSYYVVLLWTKCSCGQTTTQSLPYTSYITAVMSAVSLLLYYTRSTSYICLGSFAMLQNGRVFQSCSYPACSPPDSCRVPPSPSPSFYS